MISFLTTTTDTELNVTFEVESYIPMVTLEISILLILITLVIIVLSNIIPNK